MQSSAYWVEHHRDVITLAIGRSFPSSQYDIIWRRAEARLRKDGYPLDSELSTHDSGSDMKSTPPDTKSSTDMDAPPPAGIKGRLLQRISSRAVKKHDETMKSSDYTTVKENGLIYRLCPETDQKTGFYCDQRENRLLVRSFARGKRVLDAYCYSGGFSLNAVFGGADGVIAIDSSQPALNSFEENIQLNGMAGAIELKQGDSVELMKQLKNAGEEFDIVICDPPKLAPTRSSLDRAMKKYQQINAAAMALINKKKGGLLLTCTCSAAMTQSGKFLDVLGKAAKDASRDITQVGQAGAASDHPVLVSYPEGRYLTAVLLHVK